MVFLLIDGVDEYSGDVFEFCKSLTRWSSNKSVKILLSSRPIPTCCHIFAGCPNLRMQDLTYRDIQNYVDEELMRDELLLEFDRQEPGFAAETEKTLIEKASGVFLWIILVVKDLLIGLGEYDSRTALVSRIERLPSDLENLYDHMLARLSPQHQEDGSMLLQVTKRALELQSGRFTALQLSFVHLGRLEKTDGPYSILSQDDELLRVKAIDGRIHSRCCGLIEVQYKDKNGSLRHPRVDFLHKTIFEYLNQYSVWEKIAGKCLIKPSDMAFMLLKSCVAFLTSQDVWNSDNLDWSRPMYSNCFAHSASIHDLGDSGYVEYLKSAENHCLNLPENAACLISNEWYGGLSLDFLPQKLRSRTLAHLQLHNRARSFDFTMFTIAFSGLAAFLSYKLETIPPTEYSKVDILLHLIAISSHDSDHHHLSATHERSIIALLKQTNPHDASEKIYRDHDIYKHGIARRGPFTSYGVAQPWFFWLETRNARMRERELLVLQAFIDAGALRPPNVTPKAALDGLVADTLLVVNDESAPPDEVCLAKEIYNDMPGGVYDQTKRVRSNHTIRPRRGGRGPARSVGGWWQT